jgi:transcriptional regulator with XRE-family HTH domain
VSAPVETHIGARIRKARQAAGLSQEKLGRVLDVTFQQVQKFESGRNRIAASQLHRVAAALDVALDFFFAGAPSSKPAHGGRGRKSGQ